MKSRKAVRIGVICTNCGSNSRMGVLRANYDILGRKPTNPGRFLQEVHHSILNFFENSRGIQT